MSVWVMWAQESQSRLCAQVSRSYKNRDVWSPSLDRRIQWIWDSRVCIFNQCPSDTKGGSLRRRIFGNHWVLWKRHVYLDCGHGHWCSLHIFSDTMHKTHPGPRLQMQIPGATSSTLEYMDSRGQRFRSLKWAAHWFGSRPNCRNLWSGDQTLRNTVFWELTVCRALC